MDVQMPEMGGLEATQWIREREASTQGSPHTRIIAMTAHAMKGDAERCLAAGMDAYLAKPLDRARLLQLIEDGVAMEPPVAAAERVCDFAAFVARIGGDVVLAREMTSIFLADADGLIEAVRGAVRTAHAAELMNAAHALKGAAANFDAAGVVRAAVRLEAMAKAGDLSHAGATVTTLENETADMLRVLRGAVEGTLCES
jgi:HPt (histidine-containing phosphotransfer) domain-containing protein